MPLRLVLVGIPTGHGWRRAAPDLDDWLRYGRPYGFFPVAVLVAAMRVAFVSMETSRHRDAEGIHRIERVARTLADAGHDVTVFCAGWWDGYEDRRVVDGVTYHAVTISPAVSSFCTRIPFLLARYRPDVIHASPRIPKVAVYASIGGTLARAPTVVDWFGDEALPESRAARRAVTWPDHVVTPSELVRTHVRERGATEETTSVIPQAVDFDRIRGVDPDEKIDVAFAHRLDETANAESLLLALAELREKDWTATIVGDGPERYTIENEVADLRIDDRVEFAGACTRDERIAIYRGAHVFVQTATEENFATELLWALACGCVGIVEYQAESSAHELIETRERSFRATNPQQIADAIVEAGDYGRRSVDERFEEFDEGPIAERYLDRYERLVGAHGVLG